MCGQVPGETHVWTSSPIFLTQTYLLLATTTTYNGCSTDIPCSVAAPNVMDRSEAEQIWTVFFNCISQLYFPTVFSNSISKLHFCIPCRVAPNVMDCSAAERRKFSQAAPKIWWKGKDLQSDVSFALSSPSIPAFPPSHHQVGLRNSFQRREKYEPMQKSGVNRIGLNSCSWMNKAWVSLESAGTFQPFLA